MKVYLTDEKELIMEPSFKWAGNPNVLVAIKKIGLKATIQIATVGCRGGYPVLACKVWLGDVLDLIKGKDTMIPVFDFHEKKYVDSKSVKIASSGVIRINNSFVSSFREAIYKLKCKSELFGAAVMSIKRSGMIASMILMLFLLTGEEVYECESIGGCRSLQSSPSFDTVNLSGGLQEVWILLSMALLYRLCAYICFRRRINVSHFLWPQIVKVV